MSRCRRRGQARRGAGQGRHHRRQPAGTAGAAGRLSMDAAAAGDPRHRDDRHGGRTRRRASTFAIGQKVFVSARELPVRAGCYAEYIAVPERAPFALPPQTDLEAAACLSNYQVAWHLLHTATRGAPGQTALIGQASGGLGSAAVELARLAGMTAIALVGSADEGPRAEGLRRRSRHRPQPRGRRRPGRRHHRRHRRRPDSRRGRRKAFARTFCRCSAPFGLLVSYGRLQAA